MAKTKYLSLLPILLIGTLLRLININQSFWLDEAAQAIMSKNTLLNIWSDRANDFHPPLFYFQTHFLQQLTNVDYLLRLLPIFYGVLAIVGIYALTLFLTKNKLIANLSALFLAISPFHIYYSQEYRSYSLLCLLGIISIYFLIRRNYLFLAFVNALLLYTHYSSVFLIATQVIYIFFYQSSDRKKLFTSILFTILIFCPWIPQLIQQLHTGLNLNEYLPGWASVLSISPIKALPLILFKLAAGRISFDSKIIYTSYAAFVFMVSFAGVFLARSRKILIMWLFLPIILMILVSVRLPQSQPFRVIYCLPALLVCLAIAASKFNKKIIFTLVLYISLVGNLVYFFQPKFQRENWHQLVNDLDPQTPVIVKFPAAFDPLVWYQLPNHVIPAFNSFPTNSNNLNSDLSNLSSVEQVYLLEYLTGITDPTRIVDQKLSDIGFQLVETKDFSGVGLVYLYRRVK